MQGGMRTDTNPTLADKLAAVAAFARVNSIDREVIASPQATVGIVTCGKAHLDLMEVLRRLEISPAMLAAAGVPILKALQAAGETLGNRAMRADAMDALVLVREGAPLASALAQHARFPRLLVMFSRLGCVPPELNTLRSLTQGKNSPRKS